MGLTRFLQASAVAVVIVGLMAGVAPSAEAVTTVVVDTTADVVDDDGLTSLREAFDMANADADDTVIQLGSGSNYQLTDCLAKEPIDLGGGFFAPPDEDDVNADGDLDHTATDDLTIEGNGSTIENTCLYDRVIHNLSEDSRLILEDVTVTGGISPPGAAINVWSPGGATLTDVMITDGAQGLGSQSAGLVVGYSSPDNLGNMLTMSSSSILGNPRGGLRVVTGNATISGSAVNGNDGHGVTVTFGTLEMSDSVANDNDGNGVNGIDGSITVTDVTAENNSGFGFRNTGNADSGQPLNLVDSTAIDNGSGGARCSFCTGLNMSGSAITGNDGTGVSMVINVAGPTMHIESSTVTDNGGVATDAEAGGVEMDAQDGQTPTITVERSTIAGNQSAAGSDGGGIRLLSAGLEISNSTVTLNSAATTGGGISSSGSNAVSLEFVTLVENTATAGGANLDIASSPLTSTASVIGLAIGGTNCSVVGGVTSVGFNQSDDNSCGFGAGPGDIAPAPAPMLAPLADNGGPTETRLPQASSPLLGAVTGLTCTAAGPDQRGVARPQGPACEVGAAEVDETPMAVMISGSTTPPKPDRQLRDWLIGRGYAVTVVDDDDLTPAVVADLDNAGVVLVTSSVSPGKVGAKLNALTAPVLLSEAYLFDDIEIATTAKELTVPKTVVIVVDPTSGYNGYVSVLKSPHRLNHGTAVADAQVVAIAPQMSGQMLPVAFAVAAGDMLADGSAAPGPRGALFFDYSAPNDARAAAFDLADHVLDLMLGL